MTAASTPSRSCEHARTATACRRTCSARGRTTTAPEGRSERAAANRYFGRVALAALVNISKRRTSGPIDSASAPCRPNPAGESLESAASPWLQLGLVEPLLDDPAPERIPEFDVFHRDARVTFASDEGLKCRVSRLPVRVLRALRPFRKRLYPGSALIREPHLDAKAAMHHNQLAEPETA